MLERLKTDPDYRAKIDQQMGRKLFHVILESTIAHGRINPAGKSVADLQNELSELLLDTDFRLSMAIDYTSDLRTLGKRFERDNDPWIACVFYALWMEHVLNWLVSVGLYRKSMKDATVKQVIRDVPVSAKLTWLMPLLGFKPIAPVHADRLRQLGEYRNQFVHYKWTYHRPGDNAEAEDGLKAFLPEVARSLRYLAHYQTKQTLHGAVDKVTRAAKEKFSPPSARLLRKLEERDKRLAQAQKK